MGKDIKVYHVIELIINYNGSDNNLKTILRKFYNLKINQIRQRIL